MNLRHDFFSVRNILNIRYLMIMILGMFLMPSLFALTESDYILFKTENAAFVMVDNGKAVPVLIDENEVEGIKKIAELFCKDIGRVSGTEPKIINESGEERTIIIAGTLEGNETLKKLVKQGKLDASLLEGKWETFVVTTIDKPMKGVDKALIVAGSDKRGAMYGLFDISEQAGVSPWHFWADVAPKKHKTLAVAKGIHSLGEPKVKYRGIFLNDEAPALGGWAEENYGGFTHGFYEHVFELLLRLKANYIWPAMWGRAFYDDDPRNAPLADLYGIVIGTSHHEPLARAHIEWSRYGEGPWNYEKNEETLKAFWREGMERLGDHEAIVTIGMRGDGDEAMSEETATELLERIVKDQREIIADVTGKPAEETPQIWALYKEVQEYYNEGMRVPEDVTLLLCDDNWGNVRVLPTEENRDREGGFGMYYHFDFVGGPVSYKWLNVTQIEKVWEQMNLSYQYGIDRIWLVNVGDLKPMELPISFFLNFAWNPDDWPAERLNEYYTLWAAEQFGEEHAEDIGYLLAMYTKYNSRRNPEMLKPDTYSLVNYHEASRVVQDYNALAEKANEIYDQLPEEDQPAFFQLVLFPIDICANLNKLYKAAGKNYLYAEQGRAKTNKYAEKVEKYFQRDAELTEVFHTDLLDGKWNHMMSQTHIGYTTWSDPSENIMPEVKTVKVKDTEKMGVSVEGSVQAWPGVKEEARLPAFDRLNDQSWYVDVFCRGSLPVEYNIEGDDWINFSAVEGKTEDQARINVSIDWEKAAEGIQEGSFTISGAGEKVQVLVKAKNLQPEAKGYIENNGVVSMEAANYTQAIGFEGIEWLTIPNLGRTASAVTPVPVTSDRQIPGGDAPHLNYDFFLFNGGMARITVYLNPTLNFMQTEGLHLAVSVDDGEPVIINMHEDETVADWKYPEWWNVSVTDRVKKKTVMIDIPEGGNHTLKYWMMDPGVVLQKIVVDMGGVRESYLGPPESKKL